MKYDFKVYVINDRQLISNLNLLSAIRNSVCKKRFNFSKTSKTIGDKDALWGQKASAPPFWSKSPDKLDFNFCLQQISVRQCFEVGNNSVIVDDEFGHFANFCNQLECLSLYNSIQTATFLKGSVVAMFYKKMFSNMS